MKSLIAIILLFTSTVAWSQPCFGEVDIIDYGFNPPPGGVSSNLCSDFPLLHFKFEIARQNIPEQKMMFKLFHSTVNTAPNINNPLNDVRYFDHNSNLITSISESTSGNNFVTEFELTLPTVPNALGSFEVDLEYEFLGNVLADLSGISGYRLETYIFQGGSYVHCPELDKIGQIFLDISTNTTLEIIPTVIAPNNNASDFFPFSAALGTLFFNVNLKVADDIIVDEDLQFIGSTNPNGLPQSDNQVIYLLDNKSIIVENGVTLSMWNYDIQSVPCFPPERGKGIRVKSGGTLDVSYCQFGELSAGITLEDGATLIVHDNLFTANENGILILGDADIQEIFNNKFQFCDKGIMMISAENINLISDDEPGSENIFSDCTYGIRMAQSNADIQRNIFDHCDTGIQMRNSNNLSTIKHNNIGYVSKGVKANSVEVLIEDNRIGSLSQYGKGPVAIDMAWSESDIKDNVIHADQRAIFLNYALNSIGDEIQIYDNWVDVSASNGNDDDAIYSFLTQGMQISNNRIQGSGQKTGLRLYSGQDCLVDHNTFEAESYENGVSVSGGMHNEIMNNEILNEPVNGILNYNSIENTFKDNDVYYQNVGLNVGMLSDSQAIQCNRFLTDGISVSIGSEIGLQKFHENWFEQEDTESRSFLSPNLIANNRFIYDEDDPNGKPETDLFGLFKPEPATNEAIPCDPFAGSGLDPVPPPVICEMIAGLDPDQYWLRLRQLLGRYFKTHAPIQILDCIPDCELVALAEAEYELRQAMRGVGVDESSGVLAQVQAVAAAQTIWLEEEVSDEDDPCDEGEFFPLYRNTYKAILREALHTPHSSAEIQDLIDVAELCQEEYGEVVIWARGILNTYSEYSYTLPDNCHGSLEERQRNAGSIVSYKLMLSPNPADEVLVLDLTHPLEIIKRLSIHDSQGKVVFKEKVRNSKQRISTANYQNGLYILAIELTDGKIETKKFIINHK